MKLRLFTLILGVIALGAMAGTVYARRDNHECRHNCNPDTSITPSITPIPTNEPCGGEYIQEATNRHILPCINTLTPTETSKPSPTLSVETPKPQEPLTEASVPKAPICPSLTVRPSIAWMQRNGNTMEVSWTSTESYVSVFVVEYTVNGKTYSTVVEGQNATISAGSRIEKVRVASLNSGCKGAFGEWASENKETGNK